MCGQCGRKLRTHYTGRTASPGCHCRQANRRGLGLLLPQHRRDAGRWRGDPRTVLEALALLGIEEALAAAERVEAGRDAVLEQFRLAVERAAYEAQRAGRRYRAVDAENRLVARGIEAEWEQRLRELEQAKAELVRREQRQPKMLDAIDRQRLLALGADLPQARQAATTTARDKKELLRAILEEVMVAVRKQEGHAQLRACPRTSESSLPQLPSM